MWKLILGIGAVVCVQLAFVSYMSLRSYLDLSVGPVHIELPSTEPDLAWMNELDRSELSVSNVTQSGIQYPRRPDSAKPKSPQRTAKSGPIEADAIRPSSPQPPAGSIGSYFKQPQPASPDDFQAVVIRYDREGAISDCGSVASSTKTKKRSLIAKAVPAVKKPWEWIRSVGSRLY